MDFVQPGSAAIISAIASYGALIPVAVVTIYSMTMLIWGSRYRWTLASTLLYMGFAGWAIGGTGAVIDSIIPINFRLHNTTWVVAHFHTYLILCVVVWALAFLAHLLERDADRTTSRAGRTWTVGLIIIGGYGLTGTWFVEGALGIPRRYAIQPPGTTGYSLVGSMFALVLALGFLSFFLQLVPLIREGGLAGTTSPSPTEGAGRPRAQRRLGTHPRRAADRLAAPLWSPGQLAFGVGACVVALLPSFLRSSTRRRRVLVTTTSTTPASSFRRDARSRARLAAFHLAPTRRSLLYRPRDRTHRTHADDAGDGPADLRPLSHTPSSTRRITLRWPSSALPPASARRDWASSPAGSCSSSRSGCL